MPYTYILKCADGTFYTGCTKDIEKRVAAHNSGRGARYTRTRRPVKLVYWETKRTLSLAMKREIQIKRLPRDKKKQLIQSGKSPQARKQKLSRKLSPVKKRAP